MEDPSRRFSALNPINDLSFPRPPKNGSAEAGMAEKREFMKPPVEPGEDKGGKGRPHHPDLDLEGSQVSINGLTYEKIAGRGVRFYYDAITTDLIGHLWFFKARDLRRKILRISYSGVMPGEVTLYAARSSFGPRYQRRMIFHDTDETRWFCLAIPGEAAFRAISILGFEIRRDTKNHPFGDFLIERVEVLEGESMKPLEREI